MYRCEVCKSNDIAIEVLFNLGTMMVEHTDELQDINGRDCYCNNCKEWTAVEEVEKVEDSTEDSDAQTIYDNSGA